MALMIIIEFVLSVFFSLGMLFYLGLHIIQNNTQADSSVNSDISKTDTLNCESESVKKKSCARFNKDTIYLVFENIISKKLIWLFVVMITLSIGIWFYDMFYLEMTVLKSYINSIVFILVLTMGYIDYKEHIIPNPLVLTGIGIWTISFLVEIFAGGIPWKESLTFSLMGFAVCGGLLLIIAVVLRSGLGMGDVKMYAMLGLIYGLTNTYSLLICTVIPMAIVAIVLLAVKKVTKKSTLPMAPFTVFAFIVGVLSGM